MSLQEKLNQTVQVVKSALPPPIFDAISQAIADHQKTGQAQRAAGLGFQPSLPVLKSVDGEPVDLKALSAKGPLVLTFYRGGWCPYCNVELRAYAERVKDFAALGASVVAITPELPENAATTSSRNELFVPIAIDEGNAFARTLGLVFALPPELRPSFKQIGIDLPQWNGDDTHELPIPATYVLDREGVIRWAFVEEDFTQRAELNDVLAAVRNLV